MARYLGLVIGFVFSFGCVSVSSAQEETELSSKFTITSLKYRSSDSGGLSRYPDCEDCMLIEGAIASGCGHGFVIKGATSGDEQAKLLKSLAMMAYSAGKQVQIGRLNCVKWNGGYRGHVNRIYVY